MRLPIALQSYRSRSLSVAAQRVVNWYAEEQPQDAKARTVLLPTPGLRPVAQLPETPVRAVFEMGGEGYAVGGAAVCRFGAAGGVTALGYVVAGDAPMEHAHNGQQAVLVNTQLGQAYVLEGGTVSVLPVEFAMTSVAAVGGYLAYVQASSSKVWVSGLADARTVNGLSFFVADYIDDEIVAARRVGAELWLFGKASLEVWQNVGSTPQPFAFLPGAASRRGTAARGSVVAHMDRALWLGDDRVAYVSEGYKPKRISTHAVEGAFARYATVADAVAWVHEAQGHAFYVLTFPASGATWACDLATGMWAERESRGYAGWRCPLGATVAGLPIGGDGQTAWLHAVDPQAATDAGVPIVRVASGTTLSAEGRRLFVSAFELDAETGAGLPTGQGADPQVWLRVSRDGGHTWSDRRTASLGRQGEYGRRVRWPRCGQGRSMVFEVGMSDPVQTALIAANIDAEPADA